MINFDLSWSEIAFNLSHMVIAGLLSMPVAWDQELEARGVGLRTFPLVAVASCGYTLVGISVLSSTGAEARVLQGIITGIGFIGGGAILKSQGNVKGTATAASIWNTGLIGIAVAFGRYEIAVVTSVLNFLLLRFVRPLKEKTDG